METANTLNLNYSWKNCVETSSANCMGNPVTSNYVNWYEPNTYIPFVETVYRPYYGYWQDQSRIEKSFKLVQKLIEAKLIKEPKTVKQFIELVNSLSEIL